MEREGERVTFDDKDRRRYPKLPEEAALEDIPAIFKDVMVMQAEVGDRIAAQKELFESGAIADMTPDERRKKMIERSQAYFEYVRLETVLHDLSEVAAGTFIDLDVPPKP